MIVFHSLNKEQLRQIVTLMADELVKRLGAKDITLTITDAANHKMAEEGYYPE